MKFQTKISNVQTGSAIKIGDQQGILKKFNKLSRAIVILSNGDEKHVSGDFVVRTNWVVDRSAAICLV